MLKSLKAFSQCQTTTILPLKQQLISIMEKKIVENGSTLRNKGLPRNRTYLIIVATTELRPGSCSINELNHLKEQHTRATWHSTKTEIFYKCPSELDCLIYKVLFSTDMIMKPKLYKQFNSRRCAK